MSGSGKALVYIGGFLLVASLGFAGYGYLLTEDGKDFDPEKDSMWKGSANDTPHQMSTFTITGSLHYQVYIKEGSNSPTVSLKSSSGEEMYNDCNSDTLGENVCNTTRSGYSQIGWFTIPTNDTTDYTLTLSGNGEIFIIEPLEGTTDFLGGWVSIIAGICGSICGIVVLLIGTSIKNKKPPQVVVVQQAQPMVQQTVQPMVPQHQQYVHPQQEIQPPSGGL